MNPIGVIYKITNQINGKIYVGKTTRERPEIRWSQHKDVARNVNGPRSQAHFYHALRKHGVENFVFTVIDEAHTEAELCAKEISWIGILESFDPAKGYNSTMGGEGTRFSPAVREKLKGKIFSAERRRKISESQKGKIISAETRALLSAKLKGRPVSPERLEKMRAKPPGLGSKRTEGQKERLRASLKASWTPERRAKFSEMRKKAMVGKAGPIPTEEQVKKLAQLSRERWAKLSPEERRAKMEPHLKLAQKACLRPESIRKRTESIRAAWTPEKRAAWSDRHKRENVVNRIRNSEWYKKERLKEAV
jgi:group I intron endonuclease